MSENTHQHAALLEIEDLQTYFYTDIGVAKAVDGVSFSINSGETLGIVGESGCGKSVTAMSVMGLIPRPPGKIVGGAIRFQGRDLTQISEKELRGVRGNSISMIFQEPMTSLNPVYTVGDQIIEGILVHREMTPRQARALALDMLRKVGIPAADVRIDEYPHQMSGGMRQRVMIAMALACEPTLLIADEPTTALDVTIQAQILELINELQQDLGMSVLLITHDLGVVAETCDRVVVMYAGKVVETAQVEQLFRQPSHPYTGALLRSLPDISTRQNVLETIPGMVPSAFEFGDGCRFRPRCPYASEECEIQPPLIELSPGHRVACHHHEQAAADQLRRRQGSA
ncbi:MAG: peptide ABC transporter ATP-binding protein [Rickettsiales bacterium]|nr:peptide ABC transporter ATP-binding protein [Rickettsiales bacterium]